VAVAVAFQDGTWYFVKKSQKGKRAKPLKKFMRTFK
jgi:hypothetical protein